MMRNASNGRRGNVVLDSLTVMVVIFVFVIIGIVVRPILDDVNTDVQADADINAEAKASLDTLNTKYPSAIDSATAVA